jgi:uncharacterized protein
MSDNILASSPAQSEPVQPKKTIRRILLRHPLVTFFGVAYAISWLAILALFLGGSLSNQATELPLSFLLLALLSSYGPALAALFMWLIGARPASQQYRILSWRVSPWWYLVSLVLPAVIVFSSAVVAGLINNGSIALQSPSVFVIFLLIINLGEELGWRGFALPRLLDRYNALTASIILGALWALWHTLLHVTAPLYFAFYIVYVVAMSIIMTWIFVHTKGSLILMLIFHWSINSVLYFFHFSPALQQPLTMGVTMLVMGGMAGGLLWYYGPNLTKN